MGHHGTFAQLHNGLDGIGKLVDIDADLAVIEYFESPRDRSFIAFRYPSHLSGRSNSRH